VEVIMIPISSVVPNPFQPRTRFEDESLYDLAESFRKRGVLEPIIVREHGNSYQIVAGERRWRAAQLAGLKEIPALIREVPEEEVIVESLVENIHRKDLADVERENAIHELWVSGRFKARSEIASALGLKEKEVSDSLDAWKFRKEHKIGESVPTYIIARTCNLKEEERKDVVRKYETSEFRAIDVYSAVKALKKASDSLKKEILRPKSSITPQIAEMIVEKLSDHTDQNMVIAEVKRRRLDEDEVRNLIEDLQKEEQGDVSDVVGEIDTGFLFKCPLCKHTYRIFHNEPKSTHSLREL
jgi:ParB/RepB/Spo0J family partition protein